MNESGNGRWPLHGIRQPHVQRNLRGLSNGADKQQQRDQGHGGHLPSTANSTKQIHRGIGTGGDSGKHRLVLQGPKDHTHQQYAEQKAKITDSIDDKGLGGRRSRRVTFIPVPDQQIRTQPHRFPEHKQLKKIIGHDQHQHGERKERDVAKESRVARIAVHIPNRVDVHQAADHGDQQQHGRRQLINVQPKANGQIAGRRPRIQRDVQHVSVGDFDTGQHREQEGQSDRRHRDEVCARLHHMPGQAKDDERQKGQERDQGIQHEGRYHFNKRKSSTLILA